DTPIEGRIDSLFAASGAQFSLLPPDNATGNFTKVVQRIPVKLTLAADNPLRGLIRPGMSVEVTVDLRSDESHGGRCADPPHGGAQPPRLDRGDERHARRLHGGAGYPDHQLIAEGHPGRAVRHA